MAGSHTCMKKLHLIFSIAFTTAMIPALLFAQNLSAKADSLLSAYYHHDLFTGTVLIAKNNKVVFERSYGLANRDQKIPNSSTTEYRIGSISKTMTAAMIMQLTEKNKISLDDRLSKFFPALKFSDSVNIRQLLSHTSGIKSLTSTKEYNNSRMEIKDSNDVLYILKNTSLEFLPGTKYRYSNSNYILLGYIAEKITGKSLSDLVQDFAKTIHLKHTGYDFDGRISKWKAMGYEEGTLEDYVAIPDLNIQIVGGAGGYYSTANDLFRYHLALNNNKLLHNTSKEKMFTEVKENYGLGWTVDQYKGRIELSHSGSIEGFKSMMIRYPESGTCIIFLSNYFNTRGPEICEQLKAITFNEAVPVVEFQQPITLAEDLLKSHEGEYKMGDRMTMTISTQSGRLLSIIKGQPVVSFRPIAVNKFYNKSHNAYIIFEKDAEGNQILKLQKGKQQLEWKKDRSI